MNLYYQLSLTTGKIHVAVVTWGILGVVVSIPGGVKYLLAVRDVSSEDHSSMNIIADLEEILTAKLDPRCINALVSDSASNCRAARRDLVTLPAYKSVIQHRCAAHLVNRIVEAFIKGDQELERALDWASKLANSILSSPSNLQLFKTANKSRPKRFCPVRWYSTIDMIESLLRAECVVRNDVVLGGRSRSSINQKDDKKWNTLRAAKQVLRPLCDVVAVTERANGSLSNAVRYILEFGRYIFSLDWSIDINRAAATAYLNYISPKKLNDEFNLWLAAYMMNNKNHRLYLTKEALGLVFTELIRIASLESCSRRDIQELNAHFSNYIKFGHLRGIVLARVSARLACLRSSSANIERAFSTLKQIQGLSRFNLDVSTMEHLTRIKIDSKVSRLADVMKPSLELATDEISDDHSISAIFGEQRESPGLIYNLQYLTDSSQEELNKFSKYINFTIVEDEDSINQSQATSDTTLTQSEIQDEIEEFKNALDF